MGEKDLVPKRRFQDFENEWIEMCLNELSESFSYGLNAESKEYDGKNKYIRITDINDDTRMFDKSNLTSPNIDYEVSNDYILCEGDILFARTGASVGKTYRYDRLDGKVYYAGFLIKARIKNEYDSEFVFQNTLTKNYRNFVYITSQRSGQPGINAQEYSTFKLFMPNIEEQQKIGEFFKVIDERIANQERKIAKVKALKAAYLTEMFPQEGETVPKRRFKGFEGEWQIKQIHEIADRHDNARIPVTESQRVSGNTPYYGANGIQDYVEGYTHEGENILLAEDGANDLKNYPVHYCKGQIWVNNHAHVLKGKSDLLNNLFLSYLLKSIDMTPYLVGGGRAKLNSDAMMAIVSSIPIYAEQQKIGQFFKNIDDQIEMEEKKLDKLQKMKEAYLEEMFV
ncbi:restriction endonuclease subunit S [Halalkalibacillus halophilus]|uniref:restriction endonuclease subunit S n=1 Tax=Halalkalibacillus halophilus TaxID=392827 RepID=UPI00042A3A4C|nr:restriction endonuclease subunit S [Halalkalibacillus halophilus]